MNRQSGASVKDELRLASHWLFRPWLKDATGRRRVRFNQLYNLRKHHAQQTRKLSADILNLLTRRWYGLYWLEHKIFASFKNLACSLEKRVQRLKQTGMRDRDVV